MRSFDTINIKFEEGCIYLKKHHETFGSWHLEGILGLRINKCKSVSSLYMTVVF